MNPKLKAMLEAINAKKQDVKNLVAENKIEEATTAKNELINLQAKFDLVYDLENEETEVALVNIKEGNAIVLTDKTGENKFADAARTGFKNVFTGGSEGVPADGGYIVPIDVQTKIEKYRESKFSLIDLVTVTPVKTNKGSRTYKKRAQQTGFTKVGEAGVIGAKGTPQFERLEYEVDKYAGYFPVTNELLEDSDANVVQTLVEWIGDESRVTRNNLIIDVIKTKTQTIFANIDAVKKAINVTLGSAFKGTSVIVTNDDGLQYLDTLKDLNDNYLLQPVVGDATQYKLFGLLVKVIPNADLPSVTAVDGLSVTYPMIVGDLKEAIAFFDRKQLTIKSSDIAAVTGLNAFEEDLTLWRAIEREDCKMKDAQAIVYGGITEVLGE